jgi:caffeoyl-CoA O-methyltransferase
VGLLLCQERIVPDERYITHPDIEDYARSHSSPEPELLSVVARRTRDESRAWRMLSGHLYGRFLKTLVAISGARSILEIGTFTGYSALAMAEALPADGRIISCELDERHAAVAREHIAQSPHAGAIEVRVGPALETIAELEGPFDLVFIDADKPSYAAYFEAVLPLLSENGFICVDNTLWSGQVLDDAAQDPSTAALREFNDRVARDPRVECVIVPIRDGMTIIRPV